MDFLDDLDLMEEQRRHKRYAISLSAFCRLGDEDHDWGVKNVSLGGMLLKADKEVPPDTVIEIRIRATLELSVPARVRHCGQEGEKYYLGVQFQGLSKEDQGALKKIIESGHWNMDNPL